MDVFFMQNQVKKINKFIVEEKISYTEIGMLLLLLVFLVFSVFNIVTKIYTKDVIEYSLEREDVKEIEIINGEYEFLMIPVAEKLNKYIIFVQQESILEVDNEISYEIIENETSKLVCNGKIDIENIRQNKIIELDLSNYEMKNGKEYRLKLDSRVTGSIFVTVDKDNQLYHKQVCQNLYHSWYLSVVFSISIGFICLLFLLWKVKKFIYRFTILALLVGIMAILIVAPYTAPDELRHFARAYTISEGVVICKTYGGGEKYYDREIPECRIEKEIVDLKLIGTKSGEHWTKETNWTIFLPKYLESLKKEISNEKLTIPYQGTNGISPVAYLPQIIFIWIAKLFQFNALGIYYMARLGNVVCSTILFILALKQNQKYQHLFAILYFLPGLVFLRSTCSTDSFLFSLVVLFIAYMIKVVESEELHFFQKKVFGKLLIILIGIALIKLPYILCALSLLSVNYKKFCMKEHENRIMIWIKRLFYSFALIMIASGIYFLSSKWLLSYSTNGGDTTSLIWYLFMHPIKVVNEIVQTFFETFVEDLSSGLTYRYSKALLIPYLIVVGYFGLCQSKEETKMEKSWFLFLGLGMWGVILAVFYSATLGKIQGVQGRYLLPIIPIIGIGLSNNKGTKEFQRRIYRERYFYYIVLLLWLHMIITFQSYWL